MSDVIIEAAEGPAIPVQPVLAEALPGVLESLPPLARAWAERSDFKAKPAQLLALPAADGAIERLLFGLGRPGQADATTFRALAKAPAGDYRLAATPDGMDLTAIATAFAVGAYKFDRYKPRSNDKRARLVADGADLNEVRLVSHACALARDMVNTPAADLGPLQIETIAREIAEQFGAAITVTVGDGLLEANYPAVHAVGRAAASDRAPRIIEIAWGDPAHPVVAIVGKGVTFDTGGLDIKPSAGMRWMKKDMGGAAHALALGRMVMGAGLPVRLVVLVPAVENAISGDAMRPGDVLGSRKGLSIEVGNTDAEGRLILADALTRAAEHDPALTIDLATLTGAARVALGPQLPPFYTDDEGLAAAIAASAQAAADPVWRMPLWPGYADALDSDIADLKNDPDAWAQAGSVTAGLFLKRFAPESGAWVHFDIFAWNPRNRPGWPMGGEAQAIRGLFRMLKGRFGA